jgi:hypothetical protein
MSTSYTINELRIAMTETGSHFMSSDTTLEKIAEQADKNRIAAQADKDYTDRVLAGMRRTPIEDIRKIIKDAGFTATEHNIPEFTEEQVREVLGDMLQFRAAAGVGSKDRYRDVESFVSAVIRRLREPESFENGAYYRERSGQVWKYEFGDRFYRCGDMKRYSRKDLSSPLVKI